MKMQTMTIPQLLTNQGIEYRERNGETICRCFFNDCDADSRGNEAHLYIKPETGQFICHKCGEKGGFKKLLHHFGISHQKLHVSPTTQPQPRPKPQPISDQQITEYASAMPEHIRRYLEHRGISDNLIAEYRLGWGSFYNRHWIVIPITNSEGKVTLLKLRRDPEDKSNPDKMKVWPVGAQHEIYGWEMLSGNTEMVAVCEGELDRLVLISHGIPAITSTGGVGTFKKEWLPLLTTISKVYVCFDNDEAGKKGAKRLTDSLLALNGPQVFRIDLPQMNAGGKDVTDYFVHNVGSLDGFFALAKEIVSFEQDERVKKVDAPQRPITFTEWQEVVASNFPDYRFPAEVALSIIAQILIKDVTNPCALVLVDVPSAGKTIIINFFAGIENLTYSTDKFTPSSFVSNAVNVKKEKLKEIDLLPRIRHKMFLIRDMATMFGQRDDDLLTSLGILTRVLDGEGLQTDTGIHGQREYVGDYLFMMLAASTPIMPRVWKLMGNLGSRLFFLNVRSRDKTEEELARQLKQTPYKEKEKRCRVATKNFLHTLWHQYPEGVDWDKEKDDDNLLNIIARHAMLLAKLRGTINLWRERGEDGEEYSHYSPTIEKPDRINQLLYNLCRGHALVSGRHHIEKDDIKVISELAFDSAPTSRANLFRALIDHGGTLRTHEIEGVLNCSKTTALKMMEELRVLKVCFIRKESEGKVGEPEKSLHLAEEFGWFLSDECRQLRGIPPDTPSHLL